MDLTSSKEALFVKSESLPADTKTVHGYDFNRDIGKEQVDLHALLDSFGGVGFQASSLSHAIDEVNRMLKWRLIDEPLRGDETDDEKDPEYRKSVKCTIFLGFTSNMISCGMREVIRFLCQHKLVDAMCTTGGAIEEDIMKCFGDFYHGEFHLDGDYLRKRGINRIGNLLVPNEAYCKLEDWMQPLLDKMLVEQKEKNILWSPSLMIDRIGQELNDDRSVWTWCHRNNIPVFAPAIIDGGIGDNLFFHSHRNPGLVLDIISDIRRINSMAIHAKHSGMIILGGGFVKHHICNANLMRNGADYAVFINTGQEFDGSDTGARPDEAKSWGKIKLTANPVKVYAEATLVFPWVVAGSFAKHVLETKKQAANAHP